MAKTKRIQPQRAKPYEPVTDFGRIREEVVKRSATYTAPSKSPALVDLELHIAKQSMRGNEYR